MTRERPGKPHQWFGPSGVRRRACTTLAISVAAFCGSTLPNTNDCPTTLGQYLMSPCHGPDSSRSSLDRSPCVASLGGSVLGIHASSSHLRTPDSPKRRRRRKVLHGDRGRGQRPLTGQPADRIGDLPPPTTWYPPQAHGANPDPAPRTSPLPKRRRTSGSSTTASASTAWATSTPRNLW